MVANVLVIWVLTIHSFVVWIFWSLVIFLNDKVVWHTLLQMHPDLHVLPQPSSFYPGFLSKDESSLKPWHSYTSILPLTILSFLFDTSNHRMTCHWKSELLLYFHASKGGLKFICFRIISLPSSLLLNINGLIGHEL